MIATDLFANEIIRAAIVTLAFFLTRHLNTCCCYITIVVVMVTFIGDVIT